MTVMESKMNIRTRGAPSGLVTSEITKAPPQIQWLKTTILPHSMHGRSGYLEGRHGAQLELHVAA